MQTCEKNPEKMSQTSVKKTKHFEKKLQTSEKKS